MITIGTQNLISTPANGNPNTHAVTNGSMSMMPDNGVLLQSHSCPFEAVALC